MIRIHVVTGALLAAGALAAGVPAEASGGWTPALPVPLSSGVAWTTPAVDARGDLAIAGVRERRTRPAAVAVLVALRPAGARSFSVRTVMSARDAAVTGLTVALDRRGAPTVAWVQRSARRRAVRAAFRTAGGRWAVQTVGATAAFFNTAPRVAAAPDGTVVLTYYAGLARGPGMAAAWRSRGGRFGAVAPLRTGTRRGAYLTEPALAFDRRGTAFLAGAAGCGQAPSTGVVYMGSARTRRFAPAQVVAPAPAQNVRLALTGAGTAVVGWITGNCTPGREDYTGLPMAAVARSGRPGRPVALATTRGHSLTLTGAPGGAAVASWALAGADGVVTTAIAADGSAPPAQPPEGDWVPVSADPTGDQLVRQVHVTGTVPLEPIAVRPAGGGPSEPAPLLAAGFPWDAGAAAAADGRALAVTSVIGTRVVAAVWRP